MSADPVRQMPGPADDATAHRRGLAQFLRFACVGAASTAVFTVLYLGLRSTGMPALAANAICQLVTAVLATAVTRRVTFGIRGRADALRHQFLGLVAFGAGLALTSVALVALHAMYASPARSVEVSVVVATTILATLVRFFLYRAWVFRARAHRP